MDRLATLAFHYLYLYRCMGKIAKHFLHADSPDPTTLIYPANIFESKSVRYQNYHAVYVLG